MNLKLDTINFNTVKKKGIYKLIDNAKRAILN